MEKSNRNYNSDNVNLTKICPCFGFGNVAQNVDIRRSKYSRLQQTTEAAVCDPTATPPRHTLGSWPTGWESLLYIGKRFRISTKYGAWPL